MSDKEQRCAIKFCFRLARNATETFAKLQQAYGDSVLSRAQVFRWFMAFLEESQLEMNLAAEGPQFQKPLKLSLSCAFRSSLDMNRFLASKNIPVASQPPYSPDLSPLSEIEESPQGTSFWDTGKHSNGCNRPVEGYSNIRVPPVL
ncbi:uncharacterized protein TNCV_804191 [Trichonephila clavipes]|nr:uncharacterized protein TNCV_804191 [Trichonephila clavipes]